MVSQHRILAGFIAASLASAAFGRSVLAQASARQAPTAADWAALAKLPDLTGVWELSFGGPPPRGTGGARGAAGDGRGGRAAGPPAGARPAGLSLTPEYAAKRQAYRANPPEDSPAANCLPPGMPGSMGQPYPMEFLLTPGQVTIVIEAYTQVRHIYTDGRPLPQDPDPNFQGTSVGRWEGDTLVVDTVGFSPLTELEPGVPHGDKMRVTERFSLTDPSTMNIETTVTDAEVLTAPYVTNRILKRHRNWTIAEYVCEENNRNFVDQSGKAGVNLSNPAGSPAKK